eukprot:309100_1
MECDNKQIENCSAMRFERKFIHHYFNQEMIDETKTNQINEEEKKDSTEKRDVVDDNKWDIFGNDYWNIIIQSFARINITKQQNQMYSMYIVPKEIIDLIELYRKPKWTYFERGEIIEVKTWGNWKLAMVLSHKNASDPLSKEWIDGITKANTNLIAEKYDVKKCEKMEGIYIQHIWQWIFITPTIQRQFKLEWIFIKPDMICNCVGHSICNVTKHQLGQRLVKPMNV